MPIRILRLALVALWLAAPAMAGKTTPLPDPDTPGLTVSQRFEALIERIKVEQKQLSTLEADFVQEKASEFLAAPEVSRGSVIIADALVYNTNGAGHIFLYESGDGWGSMWTYEARGCSTGIVHNIRTAPTTYKAISRAGL